MSHGQRYACVSCGHSKMLPEHPMAGKLSVRTGCPDCGRLRRHQAVGRCYELAGVAYR